MKRTDIYLNITDEEYNNADIKELLRWLDNDYLSNSQGNRVVKQIFKLLIEKVYKDE